MWNVSLRIRNIFCFIFRRIESFPFTFVANAFVTTNFRCILMCIILCMSCAPRARPQCYFAQMTGTKLEYIYLCEYKNCDVLWPRCCLFFFVLSLNFVSMIECEHHVKMSVELHSLVALSLKKKKQNKILSARKFDRVSAFQRNQCPNVMYRFQRSVQIECFRADK